jgi:hypothetical protein
VESGYFIQVSLLPDLNKMMLKDGDPLSAVIPIAENCPEYCFQKKTQKTSKQDIKIGQQRYLEMIEHQKHQLEGNNNHE